MTAATGSDASRALRIAATLRLPLLAFSLPYVWGMTQGLGTAVRLLCVVAHAAGLLAVAASATAADGREGLGPHFGVSTDPSVYDTALAGRAMWPLVATSALAGLLLTPTAIAAPVAVAALLGGGLVWCRLDRSRRLLGYPELCAGPLVLLVPGALLDLSTTASVPWVDTVAGGAFLTAYLLAGHIRDRAGDLEGRTPTVATRNLPLARAWLLALTVLAVLMAGWPLALPLPGSAYPRIFGALAFAAAATVRRHRVPVMAVAHGLFALSLLA